MKDWIDRLAAVECPAITARRARRGELAGAPEDPLVWVRAQDEFVWDSDGKRFIDMTAGFGVMVLGHSHRSVRSAVEKQLGSLWHALGDVHPSDKKIELMEKLSELSPFDEARVILGLSGSDAIDAALKTAQLVTKKPGVIAFDGGYHGLASGPLATNGYRASMREPFDRSLNPHVTFVPFATTAEQLADLTSTLRETDTGEIGALLFEPIQGRGGINVPADGLLKTLRTFCDERGLLLVADEVLTGFGRAGVCWQSAEAAPDLLCVGKALGGGLPISACIGPLEHMAAWGAPTSEALHTGTFFGNPLSCAAALGFLEAWEEGEAPKLAIDRGALLRRVLEQCGRGSVRGKAMMLALELGEPNAGLWLAQQLRARGVIVLPNGPEASGIQVTPPLNLAPESIAAFSNALGAALREGPTSSHPKQAAKTPPPGPATAQEDRRALLYAEIASLIERLANGDRDEAARDTLIDEVCDWQTEQVPALAAWNSVMQGDALPVAAFRHTRIATFAEQDEIGRFLTSGTTTAERGVHVHRDLSLYDLAARSAAKFALFPDCESMDLLILAPKHEDAPTSSLFYMLDRFADWFGAETGWFVKDGAIDVSNFKRRLNDAKTRGRPVALLGTSLAFLQLEEAFDERFSLPAGSRLMHTGGFKGQTLEITPDALRDQLAARYGIEPPFVVREYGMTEMSSQLYEWSLRDALAGRPARRTYWIPGWVRVTEIAPASLMGIGPSTDESILRIDDLANLDTCVALQTFDSGRVEGASLALSGRLSTAPMRGCSLTAEQWRTLKSTQGQHHAS